MKDRIHVFKRNFEPSLVKTSNMIQALRMAYSCWLIDKDVVLRAFEHTPLKNFVFIETRENK